MVSFDPMDPFFKYLSLDFSYKSQQPVAALAEARFLLVYLLINNVLEEINTYFSKVSIGRK